MPKHVTHVEARCTRALPYLYVFEFTIGINADSMRVVQYLAEAHLEPDMRTFLAEPHNEDGILRIVWAKDRQVCNFVIYSKDSVALGDCTFRKTLYNLYMCIIHGVDEFGSTCDCAYFLTNSVSEEALAYCLKVLRNAALQLDPSFDLASNVTDKGPGERGMFRYALPLCYELVTHML